MTRRTRSKRSNGPPGRIPYDNENRIAVLLDDELQRFGLSILRLKDPQYPEKPKLLTRNERGNTNNTCVRIEGYEYVFGFESAGAGVRWAQAQQEDEGGPQQRRPQVDLHHGLRDRTHPRHPDDRNRRWRADAGCTIPPW